MFIALLALCISGCTTSPPPAEPAGLAEPASASRQGQKWNLNANGVMMHGYDPVSYRGEAPTMGSADISVEWDGATWHFTSEENRQRFQEAPTDYAPSLGGYCTFGIVLEKKLDGDPLVYWMQDDALYLFLNEEVQQKFMQDISGNLEKVSAGWSRISALNGEG